MLDIVQGYWGEKMSGHYAKRIARATLESGALKFDTVNYFVWTSGHKMPVYNDNRVFLSEYRNRMLVLEGFVEIISHNNMPYDMIFGVATAGIPFAVTLANTLRVPFGYVRSEAKQHGLNKQIEGPDPKNKNVIVVEELVSTGMSSANAVHALRNAGAILDNCLCIYDYEFDVSKRVFDGLEPFRESEKLSSPCRVHSLCTYDMLLETAIEIGYIDAAQVDILRTWKRNPFA